MEGEGFFCDYMHPQIYMYAKVIYMIKVLHRTWKLYQIQPAIVCY